MTARRYAAVPARDAEKRYASDLSNQEFAILAPLVAQKPGSGKQRTVNIREILNAIFISSENRVPMADAANRFSAVESRLVLLSHLAQ